MPTMHSYLSFVNFTEPLLQRKSEVLADRFIIYAPSLLGYALSLAPLHRSSRDKGGDSHNLNSEGRLKGLAPPADSSTVCHTTAETEMPPVSEIATDKIV